MCVCVCKRKNIYRIRERDRLVVVIGCNLKLNLRDFSSLCSLKCSWKNVYTDFPACLEPLACDRLRSGLSLSAFYFSSFSFYIYSNAAELYNLVGVS